MEFILSCFVELFLENEIVLFFFLVSFMLEFPYFHLISIKSVEIKMKN